MQFYHSQLRSLELLFELCKKEHIELAVVNMPIRKCNLDLLNPTLAENYKRDLIELTERKQVQFVDFCDLNRYNQSDYRDSVHLNAFGGKIFVGELSRRY